MTDPPQDPRLVPEGIQATGAVSHLVVPWAQLPIPEGGCLGQLTRDYRFFTLAIPILYLPEFCEQVLPFYEAESGQELRIQEVYVFSLEPYFGNLLGSWGFLFQVLPVEEFMPFSEYLGSVAMHIPGRGMLRIRHQDMPITDPLDPQRRTINVRGFCLETTKGSHFFRQRITPLGLLRAEYHYDPDLVWEDTIRFYNAWQRGTSQPYRDAEGTSG